MTNDHQGHAGVRCAPWITWTDSATELVLFDGRDGSYHALNGSASLVWQRLAAGESPDQATVGIAAEYGLSLDVAGESVAGFVAQALAKGLLVAE